MNSATRLRHRIARTWSEVEGRAEVHGQPGEDGLRSERVNRLLFPPFGVAALVRPGPLRPWRCRLFGHLVAKDCPECYGAVPWGECYRGCGAFAWPAE